MTESTTAIRQAQVGFLSSKPGEEEAYFDFTQSFTNLSLSPATFLKLKEELDKFGTPGSEARRNQDKFVQVEHLKGGLSWTARFCDLQEP